MNQHEYNALSQEWLSHEARTLYVMCLRRHMDYATGIVGEKRGVSYQMFQEHLEVTPRKGSTGRPYVPTLNAIRNMEKQLIQAGLIQKIKRASRFEKMRYRLVLASTKPLRPDEEQQRNDIEGATPGMPGNIRVSEGMNNKGTTSDEQHTSVTSVNTVTLMEKSWWPSELCLDSLRLHAGVPKEFSEGLVSDFIGFWIVSGESHEWDRKFYTHSKHKWVNRHENRQRSSAAMSAVDKVRAATNTGF